MQMFSLSTMRGLSQSIVKYMFISGSYHGTVPTMERLEKQAVAQLFLHCFQELLVARQSKKFGAAWNPVTL